MVQRREKGQNVRRKTATLKASSLMAYSYIYLNIVN